MNIIEKKISEIKPYFKNAKEHSDKQIKKIADSISEFGFNQPIVLDKDNVIIVGHGRYMAAQSLEMQTVPTITIDLDEEHAKAYRLADNKLNESNWDMDIVIEELKGLSLDMIDLTGFNSNLILESKEDNPDLSMVGKPRSELGDLYELGPHKLICGDSTDPKTYEKLLGKERPRLIFTDPPYSVDYHSTKGTSKTKASYGYESDKFGGTGGRIFNDDKTPEEAIIFYKDILTQLYNFSTDDVTIYWWYSNSLFDVNINAWRQTNWHYSQTIFWLKEHMVFSWGQLYHRIYEPCMVGWKLGQKHYVNGTFANLTEFWSLDNKRILDQLDLWQEKRDKTNEYIHPTQKPVRLAERALKRSSDRDDIVLDAFGGSGSTLIACDQLDRRARLIELDPKFVDAIVTRYCQYKEDNTIKKNGEVIQWIV